MAPKVCTFLDGLKLHTQAELDARETDSPTPHTRRSSQTLWYTKISPFMITYHTL